MSDRLSYQSSALLSASCKIPDPPGISLWGGALRPGDTVIHTADAAKKSIGLVQLNKLQRYFGVSELGDNGMELSGEAFIDVLGRILMESNCRTTSGVLVQLFRQIDADANGGVDWGELCTFMSSSNNRDQHQSHGGGPSRIRVKHQKKGNDNRLARNTGTTDYPCNVQCISFVEQLGVWVIGCQDSTLRVMDADCREQLRCVNIARDKGALVAQLVGEPASALKPVSAPCLGQTTAPKPFELKTETAALRRECTWVLHVGYLSRSNLIVAVLTGGAMVFVSPDTWTVVSEARPMRGSRIVLGSPTSLLCFESPHQVRNQGFRMVQRRLQGDLDDDSSICDWLAIGDDQGVLYLFVFRAGWRIDSPQTGSAAGTLTWHNVFRAACRVHFPRNHLISSEDQQSASVGSVKNHFKKNHAALHNVVAHTKRPLQSNYIQRLNNDQYICSITSLTFEATLGCVYTTSDDTTIKNIDITKLVKDEQLPSVAVAGGGCQYRAECFDGCVVSGPVYTEPGCVRKVITLHNSPVHTLVLSQDHKFNVSASGDGVILVWDAVNSQLMHCIEDTLDTPRWIFLTADAQKLVSLSSGKALKVWQIHPDVTSLQSDMPVNRGGQQGFLTSYTSPSVKVTAAAFHAGKNRQCIGNRYLKVLQVEFANLITVTESPSNWVEPIAHSGDIDVVDEESTETDSDKNTLLQIDKAIEAFSLPIGKIMSNRIGGIHNFVTAKRKNLVKTDVDAAASRAWKVIPGALPLASVVVNRHFGQVITADTKGYIRSYDIATGTLLYCFDSGLRVSTIALDSNERRIFVGAQDGTLVMLNVANGQILTTFVNPDDQYRDVVSKDRYIISILYATSHRRSNALGSVIAATPGVPLLVWTLNPGETLQPHVRKLGYTRAPTSSATEAQRRGLSGHTDDIIQVISCEELVATVGADGTVLLIKIESSVPHARLSLWPRRLFELKMHAHGRNHCAAYLRAYDALLVAGGDGVLRVFSCQNGTLLFEKHLGCVRSHRVNQRYFTTVEDDGQDEPTYQGTLDIIDGKVYPTSEQITCMSIYEGSLNLLSKLHTQGHHTTNSDTQINILSVERMNGVDLQNNQYLCSEAKKIANDAAVKLVNRAFGLGTLDAAAARFHYNTQTSRSRDSLAFLYAFPPPKYEIAHHVQTIEEKFHVFKKKQEPETPSKVRAELPTALSEPSLLVTGDSGGWISVWDLSALDLAYCAQYSRWVNTVLERSMASTGSLTSAPVQVQSSSSDYTSVDSAISKKLPPAALFAPDGVFVPATSAACISNSLSTLSHLSGNHELCGYNNNKSCNGLCGKPNASSSVCAAMYPSGRVNPATFNMLHDTPLYNEKYEPAVFPHVADPILPLMYPPFPSLMPLVIRFRAHQGSVIHAEWVPHLRLIFTASGDGDVALWTLDGTRVGTFHPTGASSPTTANKPESMTSNNDPSETTPTSLITPTSTSSVTKADSRGQRKNTLSHVSSNDDRASDSKTLDLGSEIDSFAKQVEMVFGQFSTDIETSKGPFDVYQRSTWLNYQAEIVERAQELEFRTSARAEEILRALTLEDDEDDDQAVFAPIDSNNPTLANTKSPSGYQPTSKRAAHKKQVSISSSGGVVEKKPMYNAAQSSQIDSKIAELMHPKSRHSRKHVVRGREELSLYDIEPVPQWDDLLNVVRYK